MVHPNTMEGKKMKLNWKIGVVATAVSALILAGCSSGAETPADEPAGQATGEPIIVGVVAALTGIAAPYGTQAVNSFNMAVEDINADGGVNGRPIEVEVVDNMSKPEEVPGLMRRLVSEGASVIVGASSSPVTITAAQTADQLKVPLVVPMEVAAAIIGEGRTYVSKIVPDPTNFAAQGVKAAMTGSEEANDPIETAMIFHASAGAFPEANTAWLDTLQKDYPDVEVISSTAFDEATTSDFGPLVASARAADPDLLIFGGNPQSVFLFYPALEESGWQPKATLGLLGGNTNAQFIPTVGAGAEGDIASNYWTPLLQPGEGAKQTPEGYMKDYMAEFDGQVPDGVGAYYYSAAAVIAQALESVEDVTDLDAVNDAIRAVKIEGINGDSHGIYIISHGVAFDSKGVNTAGEGLVTQIVDGEYIPVYPENVALEKIIYPKR